MAYDPEALCPTWEAFLVSVTGGDDDLARFLQRAVGYSLTGSTREQVVLLLFGLGANGKSTFLETVRAALGEHAAQAEFSTFLRQDSSAVRNDIARLEGVRFLTAVEADAGRVLAEALIKQVTGGDLLVARFLYHEHFEFRPMFKIWLAANRRPIIRGTDRGIWRRMRLVPFLQSIPEEEQDRDLMKKLRGELPGILAWAVRGCQDWLAHGLGTPAAVLRATQEYREEMDPLHGFLAECCRTGPRESELAGALYDAFCLWADGAAEDALSKKAFGTRLAERGFEPVKGSRGSRAWRGLRLLREDERDPDRG